MIVWTKPHAVDVSTHKPKDKNLPTKVVDICTDQCCNLDIKSDVCTISYVFIPSVPLNDYNEKMVLTVEGVRVSRHKDIHPEDSDDPADIGLSSEEEADGMDEEPHIRRKYHQAAQPLPPEPEQTPAGGPAQSSSTGDDTATIQVPVAALQEVHRILGQIIGRENPQVSSANPQPQQPEGEIPFAVPKPKKGEKS